MTLKPVDPSKSESMHTTRLAFSSFDVRSNTVETASPNCTRTAPFSFDEPWKVDASEAGWMALRMAAHLGLRFSRYFIAGSTLTTCSYTTETSVKLKSHSGYEHREHGWNPLDLFKEKETFSTRAYKYTFGRTFNARCHLSLDNNSDRSLSSDSLAHGSVQVVNVFTLAVKGLQAVTLKGLADIVSFEVV